MALPPSMAVLVTLVVAGLLASATAATESNGSYRLAYTTYTDAGGVVVQVAEGTLGSGRPKITPGVVAIAGNSRGAGQLALSPSGESLAFIVWRTGSACAANADLEPGCWALATWSLAGQGGAMTLATMQGSAGLAGQPVWSPDGRSIAFVSHAAGSYWNLTVVTVATKATRTVAQIFVPASELPGTVDDPPLAWAECIRPAWLGSDSLVYVDWGVEHGRSKLFQVNTTVGGRIYNKGQQHERLDLYWYSNTTVMGPPATGFCRPVVHPVHGTVAVAVYRHDDDRQPWHAEVLDAETYGYEGVQPDEAWPLAGGSALLGAGQLQWSPLEQKQLALVEFNLSWSPHPPGNGTAANAALRVMQCPLPGVPKKHVIEVLNVDSNSSMMHGNVASGGPKWSPDGGMLAFSNDGVVSVVAIGTSGERVGDVQVVSGATGMIDVFNQNIVWLPPKAESDLLGKTVPP